MYVELKNINKTYGSYQASRNVNFGIEKGKLIGLLGPSGSGKTTILRMIAGLETPDSGEVIIDGKVVNDVPASQRGIGFVFQNYALFPTMTVAKNIAAGLKGSKEEKQKKVQEMIEKFELTGLADRLPGQLSGGQQQRVALARTLAQNPEIILADEPVAALDPVTAKQVMSDFRKINQDMNISILINIHHVELALEYADRIIGIRAGKIVYDGPSENVTQDVLNTIYEGKIPEKTEEA